MGWAGQHRTVRHLHACQVWQGMIMVPFVSRDIAANVNQPGIDVSRLIL
jgi:hypothetical protein